jgi:hypothetical protein
MGGLVARYYVQRLGGDERVHTLVTLGTPHAGTMPRPAPSGGQATETGKGFRRTGAEPRCTNGSWSCERHGPGDRASARVPAIHPTSTPGSSWCAGRPSVAAGRRSRRAPICSMLADDVNHTLRCAPMSSRHADDGTCPRRSRGGTVGQERALPSTFCRCTCRRPVGCLQSNARPLWSAEPLQQTEGPPPCRSAPPRRHAAAERQLALQSDLWPWSRRSGR